MNVLLVDRGGDFLDFAIRCEAAGHSVRWFVAPKANGDRQGIGDGLGFRVSDYHPHMKWADLTLVSDNTWYMEELTGYKRKGFPVMSPSPEAAALELDRLKGQDSFERGGLAVMPFESFTDYDEAIAYVIKEQKRLVSKPFGDADKAMSYVSQSPRDLIAMLTRWKRTEKGKHTFLLQEFVGGVEMAVGAWFGPGGFSRYVLENFEFKKLMNDNLGCNTGEQGTVIKYVDKAESKLFQETLAKVEDQLHRLDYTGYVDIATIIDGDGQARPLEYTMRLGWPCFYIQQVLHREPVEFMADLLEGKDTLRPRKEVATGVVLTIPDFPYSHLTNKEVSGYPVYNLDDDNEYRDNLHPASLSYGSASDNKGNLKPCFVSAGDYLMVATGTGRTVLSSKQAAYDAIESVEVPNSKGYRTDIADRLEKELPILHKHGYAKDFTWN